MSKRDVTLITVGTGKTGRRVVERLQHRGLPLRSGSRSGKPAFDWEDRETWSPCLDGMTQAYVTYYPDVCVPGLWTHSNRSSLAQWKQASEKSFFYPAEEKSRPFTRRMR